MRAALSLSMLLVAVGCLACADANWFRPFGKDKHHRHVKDDWNPLPDDYQTLPAAQKLALLWQQITNTKYDTLPAWAGQGFLDLLKKLRVFFDLSPSMDYVSDVIPENRPKAIHTYAVVGQIEFKPVPGSPVNYTGIFATGAIGVIRLSLAADPKLQGYIPGVAVKLLRDGIPSANIVSLNTIDGQGTNANFFQYFTRTWIPDATSVVGKAIGAIFALTEPDPGTLPVRDVALYEANGKPVPGKAVYPNMLQLVPDDSLTGLIPTDTTDDIRNIMLTQITPGPLYHVYAMISMTDPSPIYIADINLINDNFRASAFGDAKLFFQHQRKPRQLEL